MEEVSASYDQCSYWDAVLELTKLAQENGSDPLLWAIQVSANMSSSGVSFPSFELANFLVSYIFWENNVPITWKFLEKALVLKIVPSLPVLALLSTRVIPNRHSCPAAFRLYMELLKTHAFEFESHSKLPNDQKIRKSISNIIHSSQIFDVQADEPGVLVIQIVFSIVWQLLDASLDDEGLLKLTPEKNSRWPTKLQDMEIDGYKNSDVMRLENKERLKNANTVMAIELIGKFLQTKVTSRIIYLARQSMRRPWGGFVQRIQLLVSHSTALRNSKLLTSETLLKLIHNSPKLMLQRPRRYAPEELPSVGLFKSLAYRSGCRVGLSCASLWLPLDLILEDAMDNSQVNATSSVETVTGLVKALQAINGSTWHETFLGLWKAALRLVQRERDPIEGPVPRLDTRLCMLLSITTLVVADLIEEEESAPTDEIDVDLDSQCKQTTGNRRGDLASSLQNLGDFEMLLTPPHSVIPAANQAAAKAMMFVSGINVGSAYFESISMTDIPTNCSGNLRHVIVEACIARNLLDTSAYFWPGYASGSINQLPHTVPTQIPSWSSFMKGAPLTPLLINALVSVPASSLAELEKIFETAVKGSDDEKIAAARILSGASLVRGWNIQEHTAYFITRLLSPPAPADYSGDDSHLIGFGPMLNVLLVGIAPVDCVQIFSLHGLVPQLACSLMTICEVFGSCIPNISWTLTTGEEISAHAVFSNAFALLLKLWRFNHPPIEYGVGDLPPVGSQLTPEYLLLVRNSLLVSSGNLLKDPNRRRLAAVASASYPKPIFVDSFPKLKVWYRQHLACIASPLSGLVHGTPVHQTVDALLNMMFRKISRGSQSATSITSGSSSSSGPGSEDTFPRPILPAWDILEAVPFVVDAALTSCAHGILSPRELCTGLKDLADYLPASLATIVSYFSAEVTRGIWKPVFMNGTDWPSPAANLFYVEEQIKKILAATGVDVPSLAAGGNSPATLPLPLAAFVSLTITYKLDKASQRFLNLAGPALESLAAGCPWPCMPIVASLWTQKAKCWSDFLVFSASRTVFLHNNDAVVQLLKSCFTVTLGLNTTSVTSNGGVGSLLGHGFGSHMYGGISPVAPGILYLRVYRSIRDIMFMREEIVSLLMQSVKDIACSGLPVEQPEKLKNAKNGKYGHVSLDTIMIKVKLAASLGASLAWLTGGLGLMQSLIKETLPSWFLSVHPSDQEGASTMGVPMLQGYALAYFTVFCGAHAWGLDAISSSSKRRPKVLREHLEFVASVLDGQISLGCDPATWRAYVLELLSLMVDCFSSWMLEVDVPLLKRLGEGLRKWNEEELALALLCLGGAGTIGAAAELIIDTDL
ncbi:mediator of RNA polymerase II transcription subunit 33A-like [Coffea eugenioides]|uniref:Mediator of RNA polymerase II transcription subunit 33A-like n=1 Tax=Coffea arabica TaxID=13443 RepID=A0ABM4X8M9_COFAR|nr:mediator of RNA polymerase II transcription subunit 33A-like [Coffea eugenioides]